MTKTSVIIVNWNGRRHLEACLSALVDQTVPVDEIIVVDNSSADGSCDFVERFYPSVKLIRLSQNAGFTGGNIAGYLSATGEYIVLLNNDTKPLPDWLENLVKCADQLEDVGIVASYITDWDGEYTDSAGDGCTVTGRGFKLRHGLPLDSGGTSAYVFSACAGAALYKRRMLDDIGFLDSHFYMNAEDTDLSFRAQLAGWRVYLCATATVRHRVGASQKIHSNRHVFYSTRNHLWLYLRCMPGRLIAKHALGHLVHTLVYLVFFALRCRLLAYAAGLVAGLAGVPRVLRERGQIRRTRRVPVSVIEEQLWPLRRYIANKLHSGPLGR